MYYTLRLPAKLVQFEAVQGVINYLKEVRLELSKVVWPKREAVIKLTLTVIIISTLVGAYIGALDFSLTKVLELLVSR